MTIHLIRKDTIELYSIQNAQSRNAFEEWMSKLKNADWVSSAEGKGTQMTGLNSSMNKNQA